MTWCMRVHVFPLGQQSWDQLVNNNHARTLCSKEEKIDIAATLPEITSKQHQAFASKVGECVAYNTFVYVYVLDTKA